MTAIGVRSLNEANVYVMIRPCQVCGEEERDIEDEVYIRDGEPFAEFALLCSACGDIERFLFRLPDDEPQRGRDGVVYGRDEPSTVIDAAQWLDYADRLAAGAPDPEGLSVAERSDVALGLTAAAEAIREVVKFIPAWEDRLPLSAVWTEAGQEKLAQQPERMRRERMAVLERTLREQATRYGTP